MTGPVTRRRRKAWRRLREEVASGALATPEALMEQYAQFNLALEGYEDLKEIRAELDERSLVVNTDDGQVFDDLSGAELSLVYSQRGLSYIRHLNTFLNKANEALAQGGYLICHSRTSALKRKIIFKVHPGVLGYMVYGLHFFWHRMCARMRWTRWFYMAVTNGKNRSFTRVELLGRIYRAGFEVLNERYRDGDLYLLCRKIKAPIWDDDPSNGIFVKLNRVGYKGKIIGVYKLRTMHPYSEYLQPYMLKYWGLDEGGKFANDYRVNPLGHLVRGKWIDEFPMLINLFKGQLKLVGIRPLSPSYLALYTPEMQALHVSVKPGLLPPFYFEEETPESIEDVQASEKAYIEAYKAHPFATDWRYFWGILGNIVLKRKRSK